MSHAWIVVPCPACGGSGMQYCSQCEDCCEHDRLCHVCKGAERVAEKVEGFQLWAAASTGDTLYMTKQAAIEREIAFYL